MRPEVLIKAIGISLAITVMVAGCAFMRGGLESPDPFLRYGISLRDHGLKVIHVSGTMFGTTARSVTLKAAGSGMEVFKYPIGLQARDVQGVELPVRCDESGWIVGNGSCDFTFEYDVVLTIENRYSPDIRSMLTILGEDRCRLLGRDVFIVPDLQVSEGILVDVNLLPDWKLYSACPSIGQRMVVETLDRLPSTLAVAGNYRFISSFAGGTDLSLAIAGSWSFGDEEFFDVIRRIVLSEIVMFGSSPHDRYLFVCDANPVRGHKGFDHYGVHFAGSMLLFLDPRLDRSELFDMPMSIIAHEFFHNWNGEAIRPRSDEFLWFTEGATVYYSYLVILDLSIITRSQYDSHRRAIVERYMENPYLSEVPIGSAANSDLGNKDMVNLLYDGGFLVAESLDRQLQEITNGRVGLIDVLREMYEMDAGESGVDEEVLTASIKKLSGHDLSTFLRELIHEPAPQSLVGYPQ